MRIGLGLESLLLGSLGRWGVEEDAPERQAL